MHQADTATSTGHGHDTGARPHRLYAACLVLFPLVFLLVAGTGLHPDPGAGTAADQVRAVAASARAWQLAHLALAGASMLGMGAVLALRSLVPGRGRRGAAASVFATLGVAAAGLVAGIVAMEAALVAPVARACVAAGACLSPANQAFLDEFADQSWNVIAILGYAAGTLIFSLAALAALGWAAGTVRPWEALLVIVGVVGIYATNTALHGPARYGLALILVAGASIAGRMGRSSRHG
jgi:hypothetical protein